MRTLGKATFTAMVAAACASASAPLEAHPSTAPAHGPGEHVVQIFAHALPNMPGRSLVAVEVDYAPGGRSMPHRHAPSASIYAYVVSGSIRSQVAGEPARIYRAGENFTENPGAHHLIGENASRTEPAKLLAFFIVNTDHGPLTIPDDAGSRR